LERLDAIGDWEQVHKVACGEHFEWPAQPPEVPFLNQPNVMSIMFVALAVATIVAALVALGFFTRYLWRTCRQTNLVDPTEPLPISFRPIKDRPITTPAPPPSPVAVLSVNSPSDPIPCQARPPSARTAKYWRKRPTNLTLSIPEPQSLSTFYVGSPESVCEIDLNYGSTPPGSRAASTEDSGQRMARSIRQLGQVDLGSTQGGELDILFLTRDFIWAQIRKESGATFFRF
jgi:hypothetical protein